MRRKEGFVEHVLVGYLCLLTGPVITSKLMHRQFF